MRSYLGIRDGIKKLKNKTEKYLSYEIGLLSELADFFGVIIWIIGQTFEILNGKKVSITKC